VLISTGSVLGASAALGWRPSRCVGRPVGHLLVGLAAYYCLSLMVIATGVGLAGLVADSLDSRPVTPVDGWHA
jgi:hypothetical protein